MRRSLLFLCTGNSVRSIIAEYLLRQIAADRFRICSAGVAPHDEVHPMTIRVLAELFGIDASAAQSKPLSEFEGVAFDFVITMSDGAREASPEWPGHPIIAHWPVRYPVGKNQWKHPDHRAFEDVAWDIHRRVDLLARIPLENLDAIRAEV